MSVNKVRNTVWFFLILLAIYTGLALGMWLWDVVDPKHEWVKTMYFVISAMIASLCVGLLHIRMYDMNQSEDDHEACNCGDQCSCTTGNDVTIEPKDLQLFNTLSKDLKKPKKFIYPIPPMDEP